MIDDDEPSRSLDRVNDRRLIEREHRPRVDHLDAHVLESAGDGHRAGDDLADGDDGHVLAGAPNRRLAEWYLVGLLGYLVRRLVEKDRERDHDRVVLGDGAAEPP